MHCYFIIWTQIFIPKLSYLYQDLDCVPINLSKIVNGSVKIEQLLLLIYNFTCVVSVKYSIS